MYIEMESAPSVELRDGLNGNLVGLCAGRLGAVVCCGCPPDLFFFLTQLVFFDRASIFFPFLL